MVRIINNIDLDKVQKTIDEGKTNASSLRKPVKLEGEWMFDETIGYQFRTELSYEKGKQVIEIDSPSFLGGGGNRLGPMAYCIAGITSCFVGTLVGIASSKGIIITSLKIKTECNVNFAKTFDISNEPITEGINFHLNIQAKNANREIISELINSAKEKCPAVYSMSNPIRINVDFV